MFQIALDTGKGVDIHLHETSPAGVAAINYMIATVEKTRGYSGKVTISHAALTTLTPGELAGNRQPAGGAADYHRLHGTDRRA